MSTEVSNPFSRPPPLSVECSRGLSISPRAKEGLHKGSDPVCSTKCIPYAEQGLVSEPRARSAVPLALADGVREEGKGRGVEGRGRNRTSPKAIQPERLKRRYTSSPNNPLHVPNLDGANWGRSREARELICSLFRRPSVQPGHAACLLHKPPEELKSSGCVASREQKPFYSLT
ncbi:uncharacterized [Tachysurus ichikawai]